MVLRIVIRRRWHPPLQPQVCVLRINPSSVLALLSQTCAIDIGRANSSSDGGRNHHRHHGGEIGKHRAGSALEI
eukprot:45824-Rhodomonas_salina.1